MDTRKAQLDTNPTRSFYDPGVQAVLMQRFDVPTTLSGNDYLSEKAWPIYALKFVDWFANPRNVTWRDYNTNKSMNFVYCYSKDPKFISELLLAVTNYHTDWLKWDIYRVLAEVMPTNLPEVDEVECNVRNWHCIVGNRDKAYPYTKEEKEILNRVSGWKIVADIIEKQFPQIIIKQGKTSLADKLRIKTYPLLKTRDNKYFLKWIDHITVCDKVERDGILDIVTGNPIVKNTEEMRERIALIRQGHI